MRRVVLLAQSAAGAVEQLTPAHGSPLQTPPLHPKGHVVSVGVLTHAPAEQLAEYVRRVVALAQVGAGGLHVITLDM